MSAEKTAMPVWLVLAIVTPIYFFTMFYRLAPSVLAQEVSLSLQLDLSGLAYVSGITWLSYGIMQLPSGLLVDVFGGRKCLSFISLLACLGNLCFAVSEGATMAMAGRFILGLGCAVLCPCCAVIAQNVRSDIYGRTNSLFLALGLTGSIFAGAPLVMLSDLFGWRAVIIGCAAISLFCALLAWFLIPEPKRDPSEPAYRLMDSFRLMGRNAREVLSHAPIWPYCIWMMLMVGAYFAISALWWAPYLREVCHLSPETAGNVISIVCFIMIPAQPILATISDFFHTRVWVVRLSTIVSLVATLALVVSGHNMSGTALVASWCGFLLATAYVSSIMYTSVKEMFPLRLVGTATGCLQTFPYVIGVPVMQSVFGKVVEWRSAVTGSTSAAYTDAMLFMAIIIATGLVASFLMTEPRTPGKNR